MEGTMRDAKIANDWINHKGPKKSRNLVAICTMWGEMGKSLGAAAPILDSPPHSHTFLFIPTHLPNPNSSTHRQTQFDGIHRLPEGPCKLMFPQSLHHHLVQVLQLVGNPSWLFGIGYLWRWWVGRGQL